MKKKIISLCIMIAFALQIAAPVMAVDNASVQNDINPVTLLSVNGQMMVDDSGGVAVNSVNCGDGTATYTPETNTLTLENATITGKHQNMDAGIYAEGNLKIDLKGTNVIENTVSPLENGIYTSQEGAGIDISGSGELRINAKGNGINSWSSYVSIASRAITIHAGKRGIIGGTKVTIKDSENISISTNSGSIIENGLLTEAQGVEIFNATVEGTSTVGTGIISKGYIKINESNVVVSGGQNGIIAQKSGDITIDNSIVNATGTAQNGIASWFEDAGGNLYITNSEIIAESNWESVKGKDIAISSTKLDAKSADHNGVRAFGEMKIGNNSEVMVESKYAGLASENAVGNKGILIIDRSKVNVKATASNAVFAVEKIEIKEGSYVVIEGQGVGLFSNGEIVTNNSELNVTGIMDVGIFSKKQITMNGGSVFAKGGPGFPAVATRVVKVADEPATSKLNPSTLVNRSGSKVAVSDWFLSSSGQTRSWSTFISEEDDGIVLNDKGTMKNALNEVNLVMPYTVSFDVNGGSEENFTTTVLSGDKVTKPEMIPTKDGHHFSGWYLDNTKFNFANTAITSNITLKAKLEAHVPGTDATIEHAQTCSVCGEVLKPKLPTKDVVVNEETGIEAKYEDGKPFDKNMALSVTPVAIKDSIEINKNIDKVAKGFSIGGLYDVKLLLNNVEIQPSGKIKISIPLTDAMKKMNDLQVVYIDDNGNVTIIPSELKDGNMTFITDHFSYYGVIGKEEEKTPDNGEEEKTPDNGEEEKAPDNKEEIEKAPSTGDHTQLGFIYALIILSGSILVKRVRGSRIS